MSENEEYREMGRCKERAAKTKIHGTSPDKLLHETRLMMRRELEFIKARQVVEMKPLTQHDISTLDKFGKQLLAIKNTDVAAIKNQKWEHVSTEQLDIIIDDIINELKAREQAEQEAQNEDQS